MYKKRDNLLFGFHGCDETICDALVSGKQKNLNFSENSYDWLGKGMYFWENDAERAFEWAQSLVKQRQNKNQKVTKPAVLGAVICLGHCLDFLERENLIKLKEYYSIISQSFKEQGLALPKNKGRNDLLKRELDCFLINSFVAQGNELYPTSGFREKDHIQIAILYPNCIKGFFKVRSVDENFHSV